MAADGMAALGRSGSLLLVWDVSPDQEEPWRRFLQELSGPRFEEYAESTRRLGISAESVWLAPRPSGGGAAVVYLEAEDPERTLRELAVSKTLLESWYGAEMRRLFGFDFAGATRVAGGELLLSWRDAPDEGVSEPPEGL